MNIFILIIQLYQSFSKNGVYGGGGCLFYPSCSEYAIQSIQRFGNLKGLYKAFLRVVRCHPFQEMQIDLIESKK